MWEFIALLLNFILLPLAAFLILLILIQRGKGGGLIGALGGAGGSSPFGSRAGDQFTDRKSTRLNSSHIQKSRMPSSA